MSISASILILLIVFVASGLVFLNKSARQSEARENAHRDRIKGERQQMYRVMMHDRRQEEKAQAAALAERQKAQEAARYKAAREQEGMEKLFRTNAGRQ